ncbi:MAG: OmpA family protein, partial [Treponema sp.]|nr:OmpA family protein [Treponema sp.]
KVTIVGHANRTTDNEEEETVENQRLWGPALIPLSQNRADYVRDCLVNHGVSFGRLTTKGMGGTQPVADWKDKDNNWKNRRVEFILQK